MTFKFAAAACCTLLSLAPATAAPSLPFHLDASKIPPPAAGHGEQRLRATTQSPRSPSEVGAFRINCKPSHMLFDDPLVYPGQAGASHLHTFFGNTGANAHSTSDSLANSGNSTCNGGTVNRSAYWVPTMVDTQSGAPVVPNNIGVYYKTGYHGIAPSAVKPFPAGLRMIAGDAKNSAASGPFRYKCVGPGSINDSYGHTIPNCKLGGLMVSEVFFPQCWDGVNLDSPDHKSHMAYPRSGRCPSTHPVAVPEITFNVAYPVKEVDQPRRWRLASDLYDTSKPAGYSSHGDWWNGWDKGVMESFVRNCDNKSVDCYSHLIGDGRMTY